MQGVRRGEPQLGEVALVIGLGLIGQLVVQLLVASGVRVVGVDPDPARCGLAERLGAAACGDPGVRRPSTSRRRRAHRRPRRGPGVPGRRRRQQPARRAGRAARPGPRPGRRHRQVPPGPAVERLLREGARRPVLPLATGPGATTPSTSWRASTTRSATCAGPSAATWRASSTCSPASSVDVEPLVSARRRLRRRRRDVPAPEGRRPEGRGRAVPVSRAHGAEARGRRQVAVPAVRRGRRASGPGPVRRGAGAARRSSARATTRRRCCCRTWHGATASSCPRSSPRRRCPRPTRSASSASPTATTDLDAVLGDESMDAVFVVTRHSSHAELTCRALLAGKAVFVEKPLALTEDELAGVLAAVEETGNDRLQVGFNRRFAPLLQRGQEAVRRPARPGEPALPGQRGPAASTAAGTSSRTPRARGSPARAGTSSTRRAGCSAPTRYRCTRSPRPATRTCRSCCATRTGPPRTISYVTTGARRLPQGDAGPRRGRQGAAARRLRPCLGLDGRRSGGSARGCPRRRDKGQRAELAAFVEAVRTGGPMPMPLESLVATTAATLAVQAGLAGGAPVTLARAR